ncbi:RNA-binding protein [bacterium F11]|nr:RNA-binding protein [bacterium F11]
MSKNIYIGNLPFHFTEDQLHDLFQKEGRVARSKLITDYFSGQSKGFGFVEMENDEEATNAINKINNFDIEGRKLVVNEARPKKQSAKQR